MKNRVLTAALKSTAIVLMLLSAFAIAFPLMRFINGKLYQLENYALSQLEEQTGLTLSYDSLSPALLKGLKFKGISISDPSSETILLHTDSVTVGYRLWPLIHGNIADAVKDVTVSGLEFTFNDQKNAQVLERLLALINSPPDAEGKAEDEASEGFAMPFPVTLRNCSFSVMFQGMSGCLTLDEISLKSSSSAPHTTNVETKGNLSFIPDDTLTPIIPKLTTDIKLQALITPDLNGTFGRFELKKADGGTFSFKDVEFVAGMQDRQLSVSVFTPDAPYGVEAAWNMETGVVHAELNATDFDPFTVISLKQQKGGIVDKVTGARIDGRFSMDTVLFSEGEALSSLSYDVDGSLYLPPGILDDGLEVSVAAAGNLQRVSVADLQVAAKPFSLNYYGDADIEQMSLSGYLKLGHYLLPSGKRLEGEFYIEDLPHGFSAFSPLVMLGDVPFTGVQLEVVPDSTSADISLEAYDYAHPEADVPGHIQVDGSLLYRDERYLQASLVLENEYLDNLLRYADNVLPAESSLDPQLVDQLAPYIMTLEAYGSSDFDTLSFNVPYMVVANTQKDGEMLLLSMDGNETTAQISQLELLYAGQQLSATVNADANEDYSQIFFSTDFSFNEMPYYFSGVYDAGRELVVNGDYDFELRSDLRVKNEILASVFVNAIPVRISDYLISATLDADIDYTNLEQFWVTLNKIEFAESSGKLRIEPRLELSGFADRYGLMLETITYGDTASILTGDGSVSWNYTEDMLEAVHAAITLDNAIGGERVDIDVNCSNPEEIPFSDPDLFSELYVSGTVNVDSLYMSHVLDHQQNDDRVNIHGTLLGQLANPFISLEIPSVYLHLDQDQVTGSLNIMLDDKQVSANSINLTYLDMKAEDFGFDLDLDEMAGSGAGMVQVNLDPLLVGSSPVSFSFDLDQVEDAEGNIDLNASDYVVTLVVEDFSTETESLFSDYVIEVHHGEGMWYLTAGTNGGISGFLLDTGEFYLSAIDDFPLTFIADGSIKEYQMDIQVSDIKGNLSTIKNIYGDSFSIDEGAFEGDLTFTGNLSDPVVNGSLDVYNLTILLPDYVCEPMIAPFGVLEAEDSTFTAKQVYFGIGEGEAYADLTMEMENWSLEVIDLEVRSVEGSPVAGRFNIDYADCTADADVNLNFNMTGDDMSLIGSLNLYNGIVELHTGEAGASQYDDVELDDGGRVYIDLSLSMNQKAELYYPDKDNPLVRGLVTTQEPVRLIMDSDTSEMNLKGSLILRGGEIIYLNRNFYMREGSLELNENGDEFDPRISFRAEIRERDAEGELIKIILSADRQKLSELSPVLSSEPSKTEDEIRMLLGAALIADSGSSAGQVLANVAASGFDFLIQNSLFRQLENRLRDLCNFDIFSFRTPFIQQALLSAMNNSEEPVSLGNFFDNTTVYIGKYIGNTIYLDALLRFVYQESNSGGKKTRRLAFQPEVGLELPSPFATIRWSIAPDITSAKNLWVPYTSISLSWSFKF